MLFFYLSSSLFFLFRLYILLCFYNIIKLKPFYWTIKIYNSSYKIFFFALKFVISVWTLIFQVFFKKLTYHTTKRAYIVYINFLYSWQELRRRPYFFFLKKRNTQSPNYLRSPNQSHSPNSQFLTDEVPLRYFSIVSDTTT
jgi:hypothetical protein